MAIGTAGVGTSSSGAIRRTTRKSSGTHRIPLATTSASSSTITVATPSQSITTSASAGNAGPIADSDCYTCRRRRVRCDRVLPTCRKCNKAGHECAGYKKGFRWVGGIASRGKMMGKRTFDEVEEQDQGPQQVQSQPPLVQRKKDPVMMVVGGGFNGGHLESHLGQRVEVMERYPMYDAVGDMVPVTTVGMENVSSMRNSNMDLMMESSDLIQSYYDPQPTFGIGGTIGLGESTQSTNPTSLQDRDEFGHGDNDLDPLNGGDVAIINGNANFNIDVDVNVNMVEPSLGILPPNESTSFQFQLHQHEQGHAEAEEDLSGSSLPIISSQTTDKIAVAAASWDHYFASSYKSSARTGRYCLQDVPSQYPDLVATNAAYISISNLLQYYICMPGAAPSLFGSLDVRSRYYLSYFDQMCGIFLLFDRHPLNPYRELLLSTLYYSQPALLSTILAVAARYHANVTGYHHRPYPTHSSIPNNPTHRPDLVYYNQALSYLNQDLQDEEKMLEDTTLASVLFFLFYETMDSGLDTWKVHLYGARKLVEFKSRRMEMEGMGKRLTHIQAFLLHSIALFDIIGSTLVSNSQPVLTARQPFTALTTVSTSTPARSLSPPLTDTASPSSISATSTSLTTTTASTPTSPPPLTPTSTPNFTPTLSTTAALRTIDEDIYPILEAGESYCFLACPPQILQVILKISTLANHPYLHQHYDDPISPALKREFLMHREELLKQISGFSPYPWMARHISRKAITAEWVDMWHHVEAYKTAAIIYLFRSLYPADGLEEMDVEEAIVSVENEVTENTQDGKILDESTHDHSDLDPTATNNTTSTSTSTPNDSPSPSLTSLTPTTLSHLTTTLFTHLDQIPTDSTLYKGTVWPCFIAGTEARTPQQRGKIRRHFELLWKALHCWNVRNGIGVLEEMWNSVGAGIVEEEADDLEEDVGGVEGREGSKGGCTGLQGRMGKNREGVGVVEVMDEGMVDRAEDVGGEDGDEEHTGGDEKGSPEGRTRQRTSPPPTTGPSSPPNSKKKKVKVAAQDWKAYLREKGMEWLFI